jgi:hypothetical protein
LRFAAVAGRLFRHKVLQSSLGLPVAFPTEKKQTIITSRRDIVRDVARHDHASAAVHQYRITWIWGTVKIQSIVNEEKVSVLFGFPDGA